MSANQRVSQATVGELAYFLQERGLCEEFVRWCDEEPPVQRLLRTSAAARQVDALLAEGRARGYQAQDVASALNVTGEPSHH